MKVEFKEQLEKMRKRVHEQEQFSIILLHALNKIQTPYGLQEPTVNMWMPSVVNCVVWVYYWPLEASCGICAELEILLETEFEYSFDENSVHYTFFKGTAFEFKVINMSPKNCTIVSEGVYTFPKPIRVECGEEPQEKVQS